MLLLLSIFMRWCRFTSMILVSFYFTSPGFIIKVFHGGNLPALRFFFNLVYNCPFSPTRSSRHSAGVHPGFQTDSPHPCRFVWKKTELWRGLPFALWKWGWLARCTRNVIRCAYSFLDFVFCFRNFDVFVCSFSIFALTVRNLDVSTDHFDIAFNSCNCHFCADYLAASRCPINIYT